MHSVHSHRTVIFCLKMASEYFQKDHGGVTLTSAVIENSAICKQMAWVYMYVL